MKDQSFSCGVRALLLPSRVSGTQDLPRARVERVVEAESRVYMVRTFSLARAYVRACVHGGHSVYDVRCCGATHAHRRVNRNELLCENRRRNRFLRVLGSHAREELSTAR